MTENQYLEKRDELFTRWKLARPHYESEGNRFTIDGIVNYDSWLKAKPKILFLLKENHDEDYEPADGLTVDNKPFSLNIARWRQILIELYADKNKNLDYYNLNLPEGINDIAMVDIKKLNEGKSSSVDIEISKYADEDSAFIKEQIELINPNIIVCCFTGDAYANYLYLNDNWTTLISDSKCNCYRDKNRLVIDFYHPSTRSDERSLELFQILIRMIKEGVDFNEFGWK